MAARRWLAALSLLLVSIPGAAVAEFTLWTGDPLPANPAALPLVPGVTYSQFHAVDDPTDPDNDRFFHGAAIIEHEGVFYTSYANSAVDENSATERMRGRTSYDNGLTWSPVEVIAPDPDGPLGPDRRSHGSFFSHDGELWAFPARFGTGSGGTFPNLSLEAVRLNSDGTWENKGQLAPNSWSLDTPTQMANGKWIMGGVDSNFRATVVISSGPEMTDADDNLLPWTTVQLPTGGKAYSETAVIVDGNHVMAIMRNATEPTAAVSISEDGGETWSLAGPSNFAMNTSKPYGGTLSTGQRYLISNLGNNRGTLTIAVSDALENTFSKAWRITDRSPPPIEYPGYAKGPQWSYPYAHEHDGKLYVVYSDGKERGAMAVLPISSLAVGNPVGQLRLLVDRRTGETQIVNPAGEAPLAIDGYLLTSASGTLDPGRWSSLQASGLAGWRESNPTGGHLGELNPDGSLTIDSQGAIHLGNAYSFASPGLGESLEDVKFEYHSVGGEIFSGRVDYIGLHNNIVLLVDPETGRAAIQNQSPYDLRIDGYLITSASGALSASDWTSFQEAGQTGWRESNPTSNHLGELNLDGERFLSGEGKRISIGSPFVPQGRQDVVFEFQLAGGEVMNGMVVYSSLASLTGDYNDDGMVDAADYTVWRNLLGQTGFALAADGNGDQVVDADDYSLWKSNFGQIVGGTALGALSPQSVPEPPTYVLLGFAALVVGSQSSNSLKWRTRCDTDQ